MPILFSLTKDTKPNKITQKSELLRETKEGGRELWEFSAPVAPRRPMEQIAGPMPEDAVGHTEGSGFAFLTSCKELWLL